MSTDTSPSRSLARIVLLAGLFAVIIGAIAWVAINLPRGASKPAPPPPPLIIEPAVSLRFPRTVAIWDEKDTQYAKECEVGVEGFYDFPFLNPTDKPIILGLARTDCDCTKLMIASLGPEIVKTFEERGKKNAVIFAVDPDWTWAELKLSEKNGIEIPANGGGVARVQWSGRKVAGSLLSLKLGLWMQPKGDSSSRTFETLHVPTKMSEPIRYLPDRLTLGVVAAGSHSKGEFLAWSPTRETLDLRVDPSKSDPLLDVQIERIDAAEAKELETKILNAAAARLDDAAAKEYIDRNKAQMLTTRVRTPYRITVTLHGEKDGKHLDLGPLNRDLPVMSNDAPILVPTLATFVRGEIDVGLPDDNGKVNLKTFSAKDGIRRTTPLWAEGNTELTIESVSPLILEVKLTKNVKDSTPTRGKWTLDLTVPPEAQYGPFHDEAAIILRTNSTPPRRIRIPVVGNAGG